MFFLISENNMAKKHGLTLLVWIGAARYECTHCRKGDAGHGCHSSGCPHHPTQLHKHTSGTKWKVPVTLHALNTQPSVRVNTDEHITHTHTHNTFPEKINTEL